MNRIYFFLTLASILFLFSNKGGRNDASTGAPFEGTQGCQDCHSGGNFNTAIQIKLFDAANMQVSSYKPSTEYTVEVSITGGNASNYYGFQAVPVDKSNAAAGTFGTLGANVRKSTFGGRVYIMQSAPRSDGKFTSKWTSPPSTIDSVIFYASGITANANNGSNGDRGVSISQSFKKDLASNSNEIEREDVLVSNTISQQISFRSEVSDVQLFDMSGKRFTIDKTYDVSALPDGMYILHYKDKNQLGVKKVFVRN